MTKNPVCVNASDFVTRARSVIRKYGYRALPVVEDNKLVGMVSRGDILKITSTKTNIQVKGIMSRDVVSVSPTDELTHASKKIIKYGIRQLPVVEKNIVGILSSFDILKAFVGHGYSAIKKTVKEVMSRDVIYCTPDDELSKIWIKMSKSGFSGLPVTEKDRVIGVVTRMDILKHGSARLSIESGRAKTIQIRRIMVSPAITLAPEQSVDEAAKIMLNRKIIRIPVVNKEQKLLGIVDIEDILRAYIG